MFTSTETTCHTALGLRMLCLEVQSHILIRYSRGITLKWYVGQTDNSEIWGTSVKIKHTISNKIDNIY